VSVATPIQCFVQTVKNRCRVCFTCVRKCPAKAIRIRDQQAEVIPERCIGCGNCVRVCSQGAKQVVDTTNMVDALLAGERPVAACLAPSFPAEFCKEMDFRVLVGMVRALGFDLVTEVAFGADLVADQTRRLLSENDGKRYIATACPAVVGFIERYQPELIDNLAPLVSPMVAMARALHRLVDSELRIVFIGPCVAKKVEAEDEDVCGDVDAVITFTELRDMFTSRGITAENSEPGDFDPPHPALGALFPISRGSLQAAGIHEDLMKGEVVAADGLVGFTCALDEMAAGTLEVELLELLSCTGCIAGSGMTTEETLFSRRSRVSHYVRYRMGGLDHERWHKTIDRLAGLDLSRSFRDRDQRIPDCSEEIIVEILGRMGKHSQEDELNCGACGYRTCREHAIAIHEGLAESEMCLPFVIEEVQRSLEDISLSHAQLENAQEQLMHSERLASMGQLAAGVAHELNNPLGVVLMYAHLLLDEMSKDSEFRGDLQMISDHADRCRRIVSDLLDFARESKVLIQSVDVRKLLQEAVVATPERDGIQLRVDCQHGAAEYKLDKDQILQVLTNLIANAIAAMPDGGEILLGTRDEAGYLVFSVSDTGCGIPEENISKIFQPFFTTRLNGSGTGLGLAVSYGIVKMHRGTIGVESNADPKNGATGTTFFVRIPSVTSSERGSVPPEGADHG